MDAERQIQETVTWCVSCMVFYVNSGKTRQVRDAMIAEVRDAARLIAKGGLSESAVEAAIRGPVDAELVARYGAVEGRRVVNDFADAFGGAMDSGVDWPMIRENRPPGRA